MAFTPERHPERSRGTIRCMTMRRIVVGAIGEGDEAQTIARMLRDAGREVILVGGGQTPEQLIRAARAEDASEVMLCGDDADLAELESVRRALGLDELRLTLAGVTDPTRQNPH